MNYSGKRSSFSLCDYYMPSSTSHTEKKATNTSEGLYRDNQNHFVVMVKECIDSQFALPVMQLIAEGEATMVDLTAKIPGANETEINRIIQKVTQYTLVTSHPAAHENLVLTDSGKEFLAILADIERLRLRYQG